MNSTHKVEIVPVSLEKHPNADSLSLVRIFDHYVVAVRTQDWEGKTTGAYIPPDSVVPDTPEFSFLENRLRIKAKKLRGIVSQGLLMPAPDDSNVGDNVAEQMGIIHYEPAVHFNMGDSEPDPPFAGEHYDIDSWFRYGNLIPEGTWVEITEKIHGANFRITFQERLRVGSRNQYRKYLKGCLFWQAVEMNPWVRVLAEANPGTVFYGEVFGWVQELHYGAEKNSPHRIRLFDAMKDGRYLDTADRHHVMKVSPGASMMNHAPILYTGPYSSEVVMKYISGPSTIAGANHLREGIVIKPLIEMHDDRIGRVVLKAVSPEYLEKSK